MFFKRAVRSAILLDFDNLIAPIGRDLVDRVGNWCDWLAAGDFDPERRPRRFLSRRVYWNSHNDKHRAAFEREGFDVSICQAVRKEKASSADFVITLDAFELAYERKDLDEIMLLTFDSDFLTLVNRLPALKVKAVAMIDPSRPPSMEYEHHADNVIHIESFRAALQYVPPKRGWFGSKKPAAAPAVAQTRAERASPPAPARAAARVTFDLADAAARVARVAAGVSGGMVGRPAVIEAIKGIPGFSRDGRQAWLGCGSYEALLRTLPKHSPELTLHTHANGGISLKYRPPRAA